MSHNFIFSKELDAVSYRNMKKKTDRNVEFVSTIRILLIAQLHNLENSWKKPK